LPLKIFVCLPFAFLLFTLLAMAENIVSAGDSLLIKLLKYWLPVVLMVAAIYYFSTDVLSGENTRSFLEDILGWLGYTVSERTARILNYGVRKAAHFVEYALLAGLLYRAFRADSGTGWQFRWALYSFLLCAAMSLADEYHQTLTQDRVGSIKDSLLDSAGALFMLVIIRTFYKRKEALAQAS
jgi:VanZ family protein